MQVSTQASVVTVPPLNSPQNLPNPRQELVSLLRGVVACPLISQLGELGILDRMLQSQFTEADFQQVVAVETFAAILTYLALQRTLVFIRGDIAGGERCRCCTFRVRDVLFWCGSCGLGHYAIANSQAVERRCSVAWFAPAQAAAAHRLRRSWPYELAAV